MSHRRVSQSGDLVSNSLKTYLLNEILIDDFVVMFGICGFDFPPVGFPKTELQSLWLSLYIVHGHISNSVHLYVFIAISKLPTVVLHEVGVFWVHFEVLSSHVAFWQSHYNER